MSPSTTQRRFSATDLSLVSVFAALVAVLAILPAIPTGPIGVPITLQTLGVMLTGVVLGPARGAAAVGLYVVVGLAGVPIFSQFRGGLGVLAGPSAGYLLAFAPAAFVVGHLSRWALARSPRWRFWALFAACTVTSLLVIHPLGIAGLIVNARLSLPAALAVDVTFLPGDVVKNLLAAGLGLGVHRAFPRLRASPAGSHTS